MPKSAYTIMHLDLSCLDSVRAFVKKTQKTPRSEIELALKRAENVI